MNDGRSSPTPALSGAADAELNRAVGSMQRPDLDDLTTARILMGSEGLVTARAEEAFGERVSIEHRMVRSQGDRMIHVRIYRPVDAAGPCAGVLLLHGGAFVGGDLATEHARSLRYAAEGGVVVVSPEYSLAPELSYPDGLNDCVAVLAWMSDTGQSLGIDAERLAVAGVSAGGALAAGVALLARDRGGPHIRAQMLLYPVLDDRLQTDSMQRFVDTPVWDAENSHKMWRLYLGDTPPDGYAAPGRASDLRGLPRAYLLVAEIDPLRDEALEYGSRLLAAGVPVDIRLWAGCYHVFDQLVPDAAISDTSLRDQVTFIRRHLGH